MVENVWFTEGKEEGAVDCALENSSVFTPIVVDEELTMIRSSMFVSKIYEELTHREEPKTTMHALNSISYVNVRGTYTGEDIQKWKTTYYAHVTQQGKQNNPYDTSVFDHSIHSQSQNSSPTRREIHDGYSGLTSCTMYEELT